ncbi:hypothetical protein J4E90_005721 [Alternaria incomplexa]|uniref:uncharacterized protein n=1 Tax=Alternaria incomplexa TaxID=1187928 RepID=UPI00221EC9A4|nr:uncharacterized protein J4E90_005721 [Alternaria incomplexa]KAI4914001.1 hypothetical protein J4E90_005721 [Alternaria incomplexa]
MAAGAEAHLDATRSLTLMDSLPPAEAPEFQTKPHRRFDREDRLTSAQKDLFQLQYLDCVRTADLWLPHPEETWSELEEENFLDSLEDIGKYKDLERLYLGTKFERYSDDTSRRLADAFSSLDNRMGA